MFKVTIKTTERRQWIYPNTFGSIRGIYINYKMKQIIKSRGDRRSIPEEDN